MRVQPAIPRAIAFVDGQNLFYAAKEAFGYRYPNYDAAKLAGGICRLQSWSLEQTRFYTGIPDSVRSPFWHAFWSAKLSLMGKQGIVVFSRTLRYRTRTVRLPDGSEYAFQTAEEKGIDVRIALDVIRLCRSGAYDVALIFSQDQDLSEVAEEVRVIARERERWVKLASAFPCSPASPNRRGIEKNRLDPDGPESLRQLPGPSGLPPRGVARGSSGRYAAGRGSAKLIILSRGRGKRETRPHCFGLISENPERKGCPG
jgi:uncharacterized LabA/DUF88 family protein